MSTDASAPMRSSTPGRSAREEALLGAFGSSVACLVSNPIDVTRVRLQLVAAGVGPPVGTLPAMRWLVRSEGVAVLTQGLGWSAAYNVAFNGLRFYLFEGMDSLAGLPRPVSGFLSGWVSGYLAAPLAKVRTVQQSGSGPAPSTRLPRPTKCTVRRSVEAGPPSLLGGGQLFAGAHTWALRNAGHTAIIFTLYKRTSVWLEQTLPAAPPSLCKLAASLQAAAVSCVVMNPVDVVSTRLFHQAASPQPAPSLPAYASPLDCARRTLAAEGLSGLYRGLGANLLRIVPHTVITFALVEAMRERVQGPSELVWGAAHHTRGLV